LDDAAPAQSKPCHASGDRKMPAKKRMPLMEHATNKIAPNAAVANPSMQKQMRSMIRSNTTCWQTEMLNLDLTCFDNCDVESVFWVFFFQNTDAHAAMTIKEQAKQHRLDVAVRWIAVNDQEKLEIRLELCCVFEEN